MNAYVALLRGISPANPNMRNDKLRQVFESLGFDNVRTVISSGNVLFEAGAVDPKRLEATIEQALADQLGLTGTTTIVRSQDQLQKLVGREPFSAAEHSKATNLNVTFLKTKTPARLTFPHQPANKSYTILSSDEWQVCSVIDLTGSKTPDLMLWLEKQFGKAITTRTYKTVQRVLAKMNEE